MVYGIVSQLDSMTTWELFRSKKVSEDNIIHSNFIPNLVKQLKHGDVVYVMSVNRFYSISQFLGFGKCCMSKGVTLRVIAQPQLDLGSKKAWKASTINLMNRIVYIERQAMARMSQVSKYTNEYWNYLCRTFEIMSLEVLAQTFANDGA